MSIKLTLMIIEPTQCCVISATQRLSSFFSSLHRLCFRWTDTNQPNWASLSWLMLNLDAKWLHCRSEEERIIFTESSKKIFEFKHYLETKYSYFIVSGSNPPEIKAQESIQIIIEVRMNRSFAVLELSAWGSRWFELFLDGAYLESNIGDLGSTHGSIDWPRFFVIALWAIWQRRKEFVFSNLAPSTSDRRFGVWSGPWVWSSRWRLR